MFKKFSKKLKNLKNREKLQRNMKIITLFDNNIIFSVYFPVTAISMSLRALRTASSLNGGPAI